MSLALQYHRSPGRFLTARALTATPWGHRLAGPLTGALAPLRLVDNPDPVARTDGGWTRVAPILSGICGSDLSLLTGRSSPYLGPLTSMPCVLGHEIVGSTLDDLEDLPSGTRVVIDPVLGCAARGVDACPECAAGRANRCDHVTTGHLAPGLQTGYCADTGGGWSRRLLAHRSQLHPVPDAMPDETAVLLEPLACAVHTARRVPIPPGASVLVVGAGTVGLLTLLALRTLTSAGEIHVIAKHPHQQDRARALGASHVLAPDRASRSLRRNTGAMMLQPEIGSPYLLGGADIAFECTGGSSGVDTALRSVRSGGTVVLSGMPSGPVDLTPLWYRELVLVGAYASSTPPTDPAVEADVDRGDFAEAIELAGSGALDGYLDSVYPLHDWREALEHAGAAGRTGTVKVAFAPALGN